MLWLTHLSDRLTRGGMEAKSVVLAPTETGADEIVSLVLIETDDAD